MIKGAVRATNGTAAIAGLWLGSGMSILDVLTERHPIFANNRWTDPIAMLVFFFIPGILFVFGLESVGQGIRAPFTKRYWQNYPRVVLRIVCWFLGAASILAIQYGLKQLG
jgi:hypothetical protein